MAKRWIVTLESAERDRLEHLVRVGKAAVCKIRHAQILLATDQSEAGAGLGDEQVANTLGIAVRSIEWLRRRFVEEGLESCLERKKQVRPSVQRKFDGKQEAKLIAIACGPAPKGCPRWTLRLLASRAVELRIVESCSPTTVGRVLKKTSSSRGCGRCGAFRRTRTLSSSARWRMSSRRTCGRTTQGVR